MVIETFLLLFYSLFSQQTKNTSQYNMSGLSLAPSNSAADLIKDGWFSEKEAMWPGQKFCIEVEEVLANGRSEFQVGLAFQYSSYFEN